MVQTRSVVPGNERWRFPEDLPSQNGVTAVPQATSGLLSPRKRVFQADVHMRANTFTYRGHNVISRARKARFLQLAPALTGQNTKRNERTSRTEGAKRIAVTHTHTNRNVRSRQRRRYSSQKPASRKEST